MSKSAIAVSKAALLLFCLGCGQGDEPGGTSKADKAATARPFTLGPPTIDALSAPRDDNGLVAGEEVRIGLRIRGGKPPFSGEITAVRIARPLGEGEANPISVQFVPQADTSKMPGRGARSSDAIEMALRGQLHARAPSGVYQLRVTVSDAAGHQATRNSRDWRLYGDDADTRPLLDSPPYAMVVDVANRRRKTFVRGENITIRAHLPGQKKATVSLHGPDGALLARTERQLSEAGELAMATAIPRLARVGKHLVKVAGEDIELSETIEVSGLPFAPTAQLLVDFMAFYGGDDLRARRGARFRRGEDIVVEARVGGGKAEVTLTLRLRSTKGGRVLSTAEIGRAKVARPSPGARIFVKGTWRVPDATAPGRYHLQVEATEGEHVSARYREILVE